jgi:hypothetical protein
MDEVLLGRTVDVALDQRGEGQASGLATRLQARRESSPRRAISQSGSFRSSMRSTSAAGRAARSLR